ncbi:FkbM family methyltransferase [Hasllibacter sp. MH4015]|uniref:FkbM family methyltransferase n=1 Tax=Hasllibacter sp. MH4015 TaxID=2854029 RepID=UPI001CD466A1|nr:FkbM family methyltransferase [Hasllibacter sp. MH4015]
MSDLPLLEPGEKLLRMRRGRPVRLGQYHVAKASPQGRPVMFAVMNPEDEIQGHHINGQFYEEEELEIMRRHFRPGGTFFDIGSNVGNHMLYAAIHLQAARVFVVEPNPKAYAVLLANIALNGLERVVEGRGLGYGMGAEDGGGFGVRAGPANLGGGHLVAGKGNIPVSTADRLAGDAAIDFVKIDVEGMEIDVLKGLEQTIARSRPTLFVELNDENRAVLEDWAQAHSYQPVTEYRRYAKSENVLMIPAERAEKGAEDA